MTEKQWQSVKTASDGKKPEAAIETKQGALVLKKACNLLNY